jgi:hypothetical protein
MPSPHTEKTTRDKPCRSARLSLSQLLLLSSAIAALGLGALPSRAQAQSDQTQAGQTQSDATPSAPAAFPQWHFEPAQTQLSSQDSAKLPADSNTTPTAAVGPTIRNSAYEPITKSGRLRWWRLSVLGPRSLFTGAITAGYQTGLDHPPQWGPGWEGFGKRYALREVDVASNNAIEATAGSFWGEDPRYFRQGEGSFGSRAEHGVKDAFLHRYRNGNYGPAFALYMGQIGGNYLNNLWHPATERSNADIGERIALGFAGKIAANEFHEFWPDLMGHIFHRHP